MWAVTINPLGWHAISDPSEASVGEIVIDTIPDGASVDNSVWDATLNDGTGGIRPMTDQELTAVQQEETVVIDGVHQDVITMVSLYTIAQTRDLTATEMTSYIKSAHRMLLHLFVG